MKKALQAKLIEGYPHLFRYVTDPNEKPPYWEIRRHGVTCGDGWYPLLNSLCLQIERLILEMPPEKRGDNYVVQIKEKFGGLRFYMHGPGALYDTPIGRLVFEAERLSLRTCELCGKGGALARNARKSYLKTLCDECLSKPYADQDQGWHRPPPLGHASE